MLDHIVNQILHMFNTMGRNCKTGTKELAGIRTRKKVTIGLKKKLFQQKNKDERNTWQN